MTDPRAQDSGQPQLTWANLVATIGVLILMVGGFWALVQSEFSAIRNQMQTQFEALEKRNDVQDRDLRDIHVELLQRRQEFVQQFEFRQFENSANDRWKTQAEINRQALDAYLSTKAWEAWRQERDRLIAQIQQHLDHHIDEDSRRINK